MKRGVVQNMGANLIPRIIQNLLGRSLHLDKTLTIIRLAKETRDISRVWQIKTPNDVTLSAHENLLNVRIVRSQHRFLMLG